MLEGREGTSIISVFFFFLIMQMKNVAMWLILFDSIRRGLACEHSVSHVQAQADGSCRAKQQVHFRASPMQLFKIFFPLLLRHSAGPHNEE